jgi:gamma-glutamylcyclotransferase (GGCT)/AIG2-like uncharacterized protein YtfP
MVHLAAYGTLMTGQTNGLSPGVRRRMLSAGLCRIPGKLFRAQDKGGFDYPALVAAPGHSVAGELFAVPAADLPAIDRYEGYRPDAPDGSSYIRRRLVVRTQGGAEHAWVYVWNRSVAGLKPVGGGAWRMVRGPVGA